MATGEDQEGRIRTPQDVRIDELEQRLADMKADYDRQVSELLEANRGLYSMLQSRQAEPVEGPEQPTEPEPSPGTDPALAAMNSALGIKT